MSFDFDLFVIGGGSGGLAAGKRAADLGAKVAVADFVTPSTQGTTWGLGGTCVNVGCIPKKLFHLSSLVNFDEIRALGWSVGGSVKHNWQILTGNVKNYIKSLNWGYKKQLLDKNVTYFNSFATLKSANSVLLRDNKGKELLVSAKYILIACGSRPNMELDKQGVCISSDDIFYLTKPPGKTLVVGGGYIALECGSFLRGLGYEVEVMVRSVLLRGFDRDVAEKIGENLSKEGVKFHYGLVPSNFVRPTPSDQIKVFVRRGDKEELFGEFDTVLLATGRTSCANAIGLDDVGVVYDKKSQKVVVNEKEQTNFENIFAVGDCIEGGLELTPVAIKAGKLLADRLFGVSTILMNYKKVPTTVFTSIEYGSVGYSEEDALKEFEKVKVYHSFAMPLEWNLNFNRARDDCYLKLICENSEEEKVLGIHLLSPNAGEIIQGLAVALQTGNLTKKAFDDTVGIHPTLAETFTTLEKTKDLGQLEASGGC